MAVKVNKLVIALIIFWAMWLYNEISQYRERVIFAKEVKEFMYRGDRFTKDDGDELKSRIKKLERYEECEHEDMCDGIGNR